MRRVSEIPRLRLTRGAVSGVLTGLGAVAAHRLGGGGIPPALVVLVMLSVSITLGLALTRRTPSVKLLAVGAVLAQVCWHGLLFTTTTCAGAFSDCRSISAQAVMLAGHLGVVAVTVAVCCGVDRALVDCGYLLAEGLRAAFTEPRSTVVPTLWVHLLTVAGVATRTSLITLGPSAPRGPPSESARAALV